MVFSTATEITPALADVYAQYGINSIVAGYAAIAAELTEHTDSVSAEKMNPDQGELFQPKHNNGIASAHDAACNVLNSAPSVDEPDLFGFDIPSNEQFLMEQNLVNSDYQTVFDSLADWLDENGRSDAAELSRSVAEQLTGIDFW